MPKITIRSRVKKAAEINYEQLGWSLKHEGDYAGSIRAFGKAVKFNQRKYHALYGKGVCLLDEGHYITALKTFRQAIALDVNYPWAYHGVGRVYYYLRKYEDALKQYDISISRNRKGVLAWLWKGKTLLAMGKFSEAEEALLQALENADVGHHAKRFLPQIETALNAARAGEIEEPVLPPLPQKKGFFARFFGK